MFMVGAVVDDHQLIDLEQHQKRISTTIQLNYHINNFNFEHRRHLCEFTGLDLEMAVKFHYNEVLEGKNKYFTFHHPVCIYLNQHYTVLHRILPHQFFSLLTLSPSPSIHIMHIVHSKPYPAQ